MDLMFAISPSALQDKHLASLEKAIAAYHNREFYAQYPEHHGAKSYAQDAQAQGLSMFEAQLKNDFTLLQDSDDWLDAVEVSPFTLEPLNIRYPRQDESDAYIRYAETAFETWRKIDAKTRACLLIEILSRLEKRFFELAYATMHTSGQSFSMAFQASGPHAIDRALEAIALGYFEQNRFPADVNWQKNMGKSTVEIHKKNKNFPKGIGLCIGCSTFPVWNTLPAIFANLVTGNAVIIKPHPKAIYPIAIIVQECQKVLKEYQLDVNTIQLAADTPKHLIAKHLAESPEIKIIDYTGSTTFGNYLEKLKDKVVFTEKAGVNSVILDSVNDWDKVLQNIAFSVCLYSGQMCTSPQNFLIPMEGIKVGNETISYEKVKTDLVEAIIKFAQNPEKGYNTLGSMQCDATCDRVTTAVEMGAEVIEPFHKVDNPNFPKARIYSPTILEVPFDRADIYEKELFGPILLFIPTYHTEHSVQIAKTLAISHGSISCAAYCTDEQVMEHIEDEMGISGTSVSFNFTGLFWMNQNAAFSDFHATGANPAGNASLVNPEYVRRRYTTVGMRYHDL